MLKFEVNDFFESFYEYFSLDATNFAILMVYDKDKRAVGNRLNSFSNNVKKRT